MSWVLVVFCLRCRARVAPPVDEFDYELSFLGRVSTPEPPVRHTGRSRARSRPCVASRCGQSDLRDDEPVE